MPLWDGRPGYYPPPAGSAASIEHSPGLLDCRFPQTLVLIRIQVLLDRTVALSAADVVRLIVPVAQEDRWLELSARPARMDNSFAKGYSYRTDSKSDSNVG